MAFNLFRPEPKMPPQDYKTYAVVSPLSSHFRKGTCAEVGCEPYLSGWQVRVENLTPDLLHTARTSSYSHQGRQVRYRYQEQKVAEGETWLVFEAGQPCFKASEHRTRIDRAPLYVVRDGDHRGNPRGTKPRVHHSPDNWLDDFATHQQAIADAIQQG